MADTAQPAEESNVCVAVKIRPLSPSELDDGCRESLFVTPGLPQVSTGQHNFTYDHVFGEGGTLSELLYGKCVQPLVDGLFKGYNATVFAYGQTGSGKTFTMGSEYKPGGRCRGVIPDTINDIFSRIEATKDRVVTVRVSFVEIHKEEVKDLLLPASSGPRPAVTIRETQSGDVALYGAVEKEVRSREEMAEVLEMGTLCRSTASTNMNNRSSRSHAIFSITLEQRRQVQLPTTPPPNGDSQGTQGGDEDGEEDEDAAGEDGDALEDFLVAKMHLVDLAGSERAKRTKAEGARLREGIHINRGLLALGNVINAIVDNHKHVPYRDSKLTRLLQDSLGGNSRTVMLACVSPADSNFEETLNTLRYADRARHIRNKPVVNRDPVAAQLAVLRNTIAQLKSENLSLKRALTASGNEGAIAEALGGRNGRASLGNSALESLVERLTQEVNANESEIFRLNADKDELRRELAVVTDKWHTAQAQCDLLQMNLAAISGRASQGGTNGTEDAPMTPSAGGAIPLPGLDIVKGYVTRISELEAELKSMKSLAVHLSFPRRRGHASEQRTPGGMSDADGHGASPLRGDSQMGPGGACGDGEGDDDPSSDQHPELAAEEEYFMAELAAHTLNQEKMKKEVALLQRQLEAKEKKMVELMKNTGSMPALKHHYDRVLAELESQRDTLVAERKALLEKLAAASAAGEEERKRLETNYRERIQQYDERLKELRRKERDYINMQRLKQRTEEAHRRLSADITRLKQQKVSMQRQLEANAKNFAAWRQQREKELAQLRKQSRKDRATIQHLEAMQAKQNAVLQRKISDANAARKRIKELQEAMSRRVAANSTAASQQQAAAAAAQQQALGGNVEIQPNAQAPLLRTDKDRREWLQKELELCNMSCEFRKVIEGELAQRAEASRKLRDLEKRLTLLDQLQPASPILVAGGASAVLPVSPGVAAAAAAGALAGGPEAREKLLAKKKELGDKVAYYNTQISDLQAQWERQKAEEESRGGGAMDVRRWAGLRNTVECRELLRTLFRLSVETKSFSNDLTVDLCRCTEEADVLRVQLEGAQKKCAQYRRVAAAMQAAAAGVMSVPHHSGVSAQDETDKQVDAVLEELHVVRTNTPAVAKSANTGEPAAAVATEGGKQGVNACGDDDVEMEDVEMEDAASPDRGVDAARALSFLSPIPAATRRHEMPPSATPGAAPLRYSPDYANDESDSEDEDVVECSPQGRRRSGRLPMAIDVDAMSEDDDDSEDEGTSSSSSEEEEEEEDSESDSDDDDEWNPSNATPEVKGRGGRGSRRMSTQVAAAGSRHNSRRSTRDVEIALGAVSITEEGQPSVEAPDRRRSRRSSARRSTSAPPDDAALELEAPVLDDINLKRFSAGERVRLQKLTVQVLKDALRGQTIDGRPWHAGSKNRAALIKDYRRMLGLDREASQMPSAPLQAWPEAPESAAGKDGVLRERRSGGASGGGGVEISAGGAPPYGTEASISPPAPVELGFTFSPHVPTSGTAGQPATSTSPPIRAQSPNQTPSMRRTNSNNAHGPWARSSLAQPASARQYTTWASSLRSSCTLPVSGTSAGDNLAGGLSRAGSGLGNLPRAPSIGVDSGGSNKRLQAWGSPGANGQGTALTSAGPSDGKVSGGALREPMDYRAAMLSGPQPSPSPRIMRQHTAMAISPRNTPPPQLMFSNSKSPTGTGWSPRTSNGRMSHENMQPASTPGSTAGASTPGSGKGTPLANHYKEKAAAARERTSVLRANMQRNFEHLEPQQHPRFAAGLGDVASGRLTFAAATGAVMSSMDSSRAAAFLRDSGAAGAANKQQKAIWR